MKDKRYTGSPGSHLQFSACAAPVTSGWALLKQLDPSPAPARPPAAMSNVLPSQQWSVLFSTSHQRWKFHYAVYGYRLTITGNCCSCQLPVFVRASWIHAYRISVICDGLPGKPDAKFPISRNQFSPQRNMGDRNSGLRLDVSTWDACRTKENVQMDRKRVGKKKKFVLKWICKSW